MLLKNLRKETRNAIILGFMCCTAYLSVYIARNVLSAVTPALVENGVFNESQIGTLSSIYFIAYAVGQLINGIIGDKIKAKYMLCSGLIISGISGLLFVLVSSNTFVAFIIYAVSGFGLSMIYAPMTKVVAENTEPIYAQRCSVGYTFASFFGSPVAGLFAGFYVWSGVFNISSIILILMGVVCFICFSILEKKNIVTYGRYTPTKDAKNIGSIKVLIKNRIIKFSLISIITGIVRTTVVFWLPTYISQYLSFSPSTSAFIFTVSSFIISFSAIVSMALYEGIHRNIDAVLIIAFSVSAVSFLLAFLIKLPVLNLIFLMLAILASNSAATMLWGVYCPSLKETGMVSSATGFLDFLSYVAAAVSSVVFANAVTVIGWGWLIIIWAALMVVGLIVSLPKKSKLGL